MESSNTFLYITIKGIKAIWLPKIYGFTILLKILRDVVFSFKFQNKVGKNIIAFIFSGKKRTHTVVDNFEIPGFNFDKHGKLPRTGMFKLTTMCSFS